MKPIWKKPNSRVKIKASKKPCKDLHLSGVAIYVDDGAAAFNVTFPKLTQTSIARHMPMGITEHHPAYLIVYFQHHRYKVCCSYLNEDFVLLLWIQTERPEWVSPPKSS